VDEQNVTKEENVGQKEMNKGIVGYKVTKY
jgi:hypothetical protein